MTIAPVPAVEQDRLKAVNEYFFSESLPEADFDDIAGLAAHICHAPVAIISFADNEKLVFVSASGIDIQAIPGSLFTLTDKIIKTGENLIIPDLRAGNCDKGNQLYFGNRQFISYSGVPLSSPGGFVIGALSVLDFKPLNISECHIAALNTLGKQIIYQLELNKTAIKLKQTKNELKRAYADLEKFSSIASHDLKSPLNNIISLTQLLKEYYSDKLDEEGNEYVTFLFDSAYRLSDMVSAILNYSRTSQLSLENKSKIELPGLIEEVMSLIKIPSNTTVLYNNKEQTIYTSRNALKQILLNLLHNAIEYNDKPDPLIEIHIHEDKTTWFFEVKDNGPGIGENDTKKIFEIFERLHRKIKSGESMGIGLAIVKRLVEKLGGEIKVTSIPGKGASFEFSIPK